MILAYVELKTNGFTAVARMLGLIALPAVIALGLVALYWKGHGALEDLLQATISYNLRYASTGWSLRKLYGTIRTAAIKPSITPILILASGSAISSQRCRSGI
jgi:hypothetical protein